MSTIDEIRRGRLEKLRQLKEKGIESFPIESRQDYTVAEVVEGWEKFSTHTKPATMVGRVLALRPQGAIVFFSFDDGTGKFQGFMKKDEGKGEHMPAEDFDLWSATVDIGDMVELTGTFFATARGEKSLNIKSWKMLAKSLRPLPEKWHGLQDPEERFRKRYLDLIASPEVKDRFKKRSMIITEIRRILDKEGYMEVETPMLQHQHGGASAMPFKTHHNALDIDLYMRIAPELFLKRLLIGGFPKVYEIGRNFRNEGIDVTHNPEFTMLEYYEAWSDASRQMKFAEKMMKAIVKKVHDADEIEFDGEKIDFSKKFAVIPYMELFKRYALMPDAEKMSADELKLKAEQLGVKVDPSDTREKIFDNIYKKACRPKLVQPTFVTDYPADMLPLAKRLPKSPEFVDAFQLIIGGLEMVKAFSELNDPIDQLARFEAQEKNKKAGDEEAQSTDTEFIEAMEHGMPPAGGVGIGIDRLVMLLTNTKNIREVILFPTLRPRDSK